jgi:tetratricopeptide (TPR) repeat protein
MSLPDTTADNLAAAPPARVLETAVNHHRAGRLQEAEALYRQVLQTTPDQPDALHFLGVIALQVGQIQAGEQLIGRALQLGLSSNPEAWNNYGEAVRQLGRADVAASAFQRALQLAPDYADAHSNLGLLFHQQGRSQDALRHLRTAVRLNPNLPNAQYNLGLELERAGDADEAVECWQRTLAVQPNHVPAMNALGVALTRMKRMERAILILRKATTIDPSNAETFANLSSALGEAKQHDAALAAAQESVRLAPNRGETYNALGVALQKAGRIEEAIEQFAKASEANPKLTIAYGNRGGALEKLGRYDEAAAAFEAARAVEPESIDVLVALAGSYRQVARDDDSIAAARAVLARRPDQAEAHGNLALTLLTKGDYAEGFREYEWRWRCKDFTTPTREFSRPMWDGSDPAGRRIFVHAEQGFGDMIQFARYLPMLADRGATVILECAASLRTLMESVRGVSRVVVSGLKPPDFDLHAPLLSLPAAFGTTLQTVPHDVPYLRGDANRRTYWRDVLSRELPPDARRRVGIVWGGNKKPDPRRSASLALFAPLAAVPSVALVSLQMGEPAEELKRAPAGLKLFDAGREIKDFADSAALLENLDLLITIDSAPAHLAGALDVRTWTLLPRVMDWRWLRGRDDSPWYPTMRLFRQTTLDDWPPEIERVRTELEKLTLRET